MSNRELARDASSAALLCTQGDQLLRQRQFSAAEQAFSKALTLDPVNHRAFSALGLIALERGDLAQAIDYLERACAIDKSRPAPYVNLGNAFARAGQYTQAINAYGAALNLVPNDIDAHYNRSTALLYANRFAEAIEGYRRVLRAVPNHGGALFNLATASLHLGQLDDVVTTCRRLIGLDEEDLEILLLMLRAFSVRRQVSEASETIARAIRIANTAIASNNADPAQLLPNVTALCQLLIELDGTTHALMLADRALEKFPKSAELHLVRGRALGDLMHQSEAVTSYDAALSIEPRLTQALIQRGVALVQLGKFDAAVASYERAVLTSKDVPAALIELAGAKKFASHADPHLLLMRELARDELSLPPPDRVFLHFALGKACDDLGSYDEAFAHWAAANRLKRQLVPYEVEGDLAFMQELASTFDAEWVASRQGQGRGDAPIFVFGMPRSGTTLVEQVIGGHPEAVAIGESGFFQRAARSVMSRRGGGSLAVARSVSLEDQTEIGGAYLALAQERAGRPGRIVDKTLWSSHNAALIAAAIPDAILVHVRRDPLDNCLGCFSKLFATGHQYTDDLSDVGRYRLGYDRLIEHWRRVLPADRFIEVEYETLVYNFEREARRLIEFCRLRWTNEVLDFAHVDRPVSTASAYQVRQGLFSSSIGRWRNYRAGLEPLEQLLQPDRTTRAAAS